MLLLFELSTNCRSRPISCSCQPTNVLTITTGAIIQKVAILTGADKWAISIGAVVITSAISITFIDIWERQIK